MVGLTLDVMEAEEKEKRDVISREGKRGPRSGSSATPLLLLLHPTGSTAKMRRRRFLSEVPFGSPVCRLPTLRVADSKFQSRGNRLTSLTCSRSQAQLSLDARDRKHGHF